MQNNKKLLSKILLSISLILFFYTFYESEIKYDSNSHEKYFKYYLTCFLLIIFSLITFFIKKEITKNILTIFISLVFALYLINGFLILNKTKGNLDVKKHVIEFYLDLKKIEDDITISIYPLNHIENTDYPLFSLSSISNKKTIHCNENGYFSIHYTDRYGFNNLDIEWDKEEIQFVLVGDSFTHGACVNEEDTISGNLKKLVKKGGVINLGYSTNGPLKEYATLREYLPLQKVKRVLWLYTERNDLSDLIDEMKHKTLVQYLKNKDFTQKLHTRQNEIDLKLKEVFDTGLKDYFREKEIEKGPLISFLRLYFLRNFLKEKFIEPKYNIDIQNNTLKKFSEIIMRAKNLSEKNNAEFYFVYLPDYFKYKNKLYDNTEFKNYRNVINLVNELDIPIIDIHKDLMKKHPDPLSLFPYRNFGHYNELGYKLVSEIIFKKISNYEKTK